MAYFNQPTMFTPNVNSQVDFDKETVEGRIGNIMKTDDKGNYTNQVVRQAQDRQLQAFNDRGLLNSSMAMQAGQEAVISKATDIASQDAKTYYDNRRSNVDQNNTFAMKEIEQGFTQRQDYQKAVQNVSSNYQRQIDTINASNMTPEDKSTAIAQAASMRDGEMAYMNNLYSRMPSWSNDWLTAAVPTAGMDLQTVSNRDTLANIANDPGQPQALRDAALARLQALDGGAGAGGVPAGSAGTAGNGYPLPASIYGQTVNWSQTGVNPMYPTLTLQQLYDDYAARAGGSAMTPQQWYQGGYFRNVSLFGGMIGFGGSEGDASVGVGIGGTGDDGDSGGISI